MADLAERPEKAGAASVAVRGRSCSECEELRAKLKRAVIVIEALKSRVLDLETSLARRGAVGGRQRLGETVEDQVQQQLDRRDEEVKTMREAVIELSTQVAEKEAQLASNQERLADFVNAQSSAPGPQRHRRCRRRQRRCGRRKRWGTRCGNCKDSECSS